MTKIYALVDPRNGEIRYVGKTVRDLSARRTRHLTVAAKSPASYHVLLWIRQLLRQGYHPEIHLIQEVHEDHWQEAERYWIRYFRGIGCDLTNATAGGNGITGWTHTAEARKRIGEAHRGRPKSPEHRRALSAANCGNPKVIAAALSRGL